MKFKSSLWKLFFGVLALLWPLFAPGLDNTQRILSTIFSVILYNLFKTSLPTKPVSGELILICCPIRAFLYDLVVVSRISFNAFIDEEAASF